MQKRGRFVAAPRTACRWAGWYLPRQGRSWELLAEDDSYRRCLWLLLYRIPPGPRGQVLVAPRCRNPNTARGLTCE